MEHGLSPADCLLLISDLHCCPRLLFPIQIVTMGLFRTIALFYLGSFDSIVRRCMIQREQLRAADKTK